MPLRLRRRVDRGAARIELDNILAKGKVGVWRRRQAAPSATAEPPTFHEYASYWLQAKKDGMIGDRRIDTNTQADYLWRLRRHLLPFFGPTPVNEIDRELCQRFKAAKLQEATELRAALAAGAVVRDPTGRRERRLVRRRSRSSSTPSRQFSTRPWRTGTWTATPLVGSE